MDEESRSSQSIGQAAWQGDWREPSSDGRIRYYRRSEAVVFLKTREEFGGLSNMAAGFPLCVNGIEVRTSEALYQACRFPHLPDIQREILEQRSPMTAKMKSKPHRAKSRPDWDHARIKVMRWCLRLKLAQNWERFAGLLETTGDQPIVEESRRDDFWGARPAGDDQLVGMNILGRLLMELRAMARDGGPKAFGSVPPPDLANFCLLEEPVNTIVGSAALTEPVAVEADSKEDIPSRNAVSTVSSETAVARAANDWECEDVRNLIARIHSMVREHPATRPEINAALGPLLPVNLSDAEKKKRIAGHLRSLRRARWIAFDKGDRRWKPGNRSALLGPGNVRPGRDTTARYA